MFFNVKGGENAGLIELNEVFFKGGIFICLLFVLGFDKGAL